MSTSVHGFKQDLSLQSQVIDLFRKPQMTSLSTSTLYCDVIIDKTTENLKYDAATEVLIHFKKTYNIPETVSQCT